MHLTCGLLPLIASYLVLLSHLRSARTCGLLHIQQIQCIPYRTYAPHERAGCFSKFAQLCVMPVRIKCTGFVPYRELSYCPKEELRSLARFKDAKSPYSYANAPALLCELAVRTRHCFE
jgi:hypothetical protein